MSQSLGFEKQDSTLVYKLNKVIYGLKQDPRARYEKLTQVLIQFGFSHNMCDHSLFIYSNQGLTVYALFYVDDIFMIGSSSILIHKLIYSIHATFALKRLGKLNYFLGI